ncbi:uncharacterized protein LOC135501212 [Lineus longissimus]|uniref:uncharacterized protein LOC135501212 n=1 Tax=Lineus longissimus TaxID=88925 RepID=UPI002B4F6CEE
MYLMIHDEESIKVVKNICLRDGYLPSVDSYSPVGEDGLPEIEPGIWFKAEVFAGVLVDCTQRVLKWTIEEETISLDTSFVTKDRSDSGVDFSLFTRHLYEGECYDFETGIDDLFDTAASLLENERARSSRGKRKTSFNSSKLIIRILHCHILPAIKLKPTDLWKVEDIYKQQEKVLQGLNAELEKKAQDIDNTKLGIQLKRESMVNELQSISMVEVYPRDILLLLETQIQGDIERKSRELDRAQGEVNQLKEEPKSGDLLLKKRKVRDCIHEKQIHLITVRENVVQVLKTMGRRSNNKASAIKWQPACTRGSEMMDEEIVCTRGNKDLASQYVMYMKVNDLLQEQRNKRFIVTSKLEFIISVRETINEALRDLRSGKESVGFSRDRTKRGRSTDILRHTNIPEEWLTLTEKVGDLLMEGDNPLRKRHQEFVSQIRDKFLAAINVATVMLDRGVEETSRRRQRHRARSLMHKEFKTIVTITGDDDEDIKSQTATILRSRAQSSRSFKRRMDSLVGMPIEEPNKEDDDIQKQIGTEISFLQQQIHAHFDFMSSELQIAIDQFSDTVYYKTWLCYEGHFYRDTMDRIMALYKLNYRQVCNNLEKNASLVTTEDLGIEDRWLMNFFVQEPLEKENLAQRQMEEDGFICWSSPPLAKDNESTATWVQNISPLIGSASSNQSQITGVEVELKTVTRKPEELMGTVPEEEDIPSGLSPDLGGCVDTAKDGLSGTDESNTGANLSGEITVDHASLADADSVAITKESVDDESFGEHKHEADPGFLNPAYLETDIDAFEIEGGNMQNKKNVNSGFVNPMFLVTLDDKFAVDNVVSSESATDSQHPEGAVATRSGYELSRNDQDCSTAVSGREDTDDKDPDPSMDIGNQTEDGDRASMSEQSGTIKPSVLDNGSYSSEESVDFPGDPQRAVTELVQRKLKPNQSRKFMEVFAPAIACVEAILKEYIPLNKLQLMTKCVRTVQKIVAQIQSEISSDSQNVMCCDDFLTIIPLILLHADHTSMAELYPHIILLMDLMAPFLTNGIHSNSLTHFYGAYQILFSMMVVQTKH